MSGGKFQKKKNKENAGDARHSARLFSLVAEYGESKRVVAQKHASALRTALLVRARQGTENSVPRLTRLVPGADALPFVQRVLQFVAIEVEGARGILVEQLAAAVTQQLVNADLQFKRR